MVTNKQESNVESAEPDESAGKQVPLESIEQEWGKKSDDFYGYGSEEERLAKRGLEDWEMVDKVSESQVAIPKWFVAVIIAVLLFAIFLSFPFWGDREGFEREWFNWGFGLALVYIAISGGFIYAMISMFGMNSSKTDADESSKVSKDNDGDQSKGK
ncbi:MAG: hypothetical protein COB61_003600 [Thiotrichales bacterium]|nr:hypothetical protein [Thiotrichales bacterium]